MALLNKASNGFILPRQLLMQQKRFRGKINIQRPQKLFYERALVTKFVTPFYERKNAPKPIWEACGRVTRKKEETTTVHPYQMIIAREVLERFEAAKMVAFLHKNSMKSEDCFDFAVLLHKHQMTLKYYGIQTIETAVKGTRFEAILPLFCSPGLLVFGAEPTVRELFKIVKKVPTVTVMAGILEGKLLNVHDFQKFGNMSITEARSELVHTLATAGGANLDRQLNYHQNTLVSRLEQIGKNTEADTGSSVNRENEERKEE